MTLQESIRRASENLAEGRYGAKVIELLIQSLCSVARSEGVLQGVDEAHAAELAQLAIEKAKC